MKEKDHGAKSSRAHLPRAPFKMAEAMISGIVMQIHLHLVNPFIWQSGYPIFH